MSGPTSNNIASGGGAATQAGMTYQSRIAAWLYVRMLAGVRGPTLGESPGLSIEAVRCETDQPVDDILVEFSGGSRALIQAKHGLASMGAGEDAAFAGVIRQFVRQSIVRRATDPSRAEIMVLIVDPSASGTIRNELRSLFDGFAMAPVGRLADVPSSARDHELDSIVRRIVDREWSASGGGSPTTADVEDLLRRVRIRLLDVDPGGSDERTARDLLQTSAVVAAQDVEGAWALTVEFGSQAVRGRGWVDRVTLQQHLSAGGVPLRPAIDDRVDIERVEALSLRTFERLARHRTISFAGVDVHIQREVLGKLQQAVAQESVVVVGDPGSGKSALLHELATSMASAGHDVVLLAADTLDESGMTTAGLTRDLDVVLRQWPGTKTGVLIVDALDAARSEQAAAQLRDLIERVSKNAPRWRIVASIRRYDLRYGAQLARLFAGPPPTDAIDAEFPKVRHVAVGRLSHAEIAQLVSGSPALAEALAHAPSRLAALLGNVFNVRLFTEILAAGVSIDSLSSVRTQADLLERYWDARVLNGSGAERDARELVLTSAVESMLSTRTLRANRRDIADSSGALDALLSANVLVEWRAADDARPVRALIAFAHHIVFDYAVDCLHLRRDPGPRRLIEGDPSLVVAIRPSLVLHFQYLWAESPKHLRFWSLAIELLEAAKVPEIAKIIGPLVASENVAELDDFAALLSALRENPIGEHAERVVQYVIGAGVAASGQKSLVGEGAGPWCGFAAAMITHRQTRGVAWAVTMLLRSACEASNQLTSEQLHGAGQVARWLFDYVMSPATYDAFWIRDPIRFVARTFASDPIESGSKIRALLDKSRSVVQLQAEVTALASEVEYLIKSDPALVRDIYSFVFGLDVRSNESVPLSPGRIMGFSTTISQQIDQARYLLAKSFSTFLTGAPALAAQALGLAVEHYVRQRHPTDATEHKDEEPFTFRERQAAITTDYSEIWDTGTYAGDYPLEMLDEFESFLAEAASDPGLAAAWSDAVARLVDTTHRGIIWRRILRAGAQRPETLGRELRELAWVAPILAGHDTTVAAGEFLRAVFPLVSDTEKERIETCIMQIPGTKAGRHWSTEGREHTRDRLLGCLEAPITSAARTRVAELSANSGSPPENTSAYRIGPFQSRPYSTVDYLRDQGVAVNEPANRAVLNLTEPLASFAERFNGTAPDAGSLDEALPSLGSLINALAKSDSEGADPKLQNYAWGVAAHAAARMVWCHEVSTSGRGALIVKALLEASHNIEPEFRPDIDASFNRSPSWGHPAARIDAAAGLTLIAARASIPDIETAVRRLANDPVAAVRYQVFAYLGGLSAAAPQLFNELVDAAAKNESNRGVLRVFVDRILHPLLSDLPKRAVELARLIYKRTVDGDGSEPVRETCIALFVRAHLWKEEPLAKEILAPIIEEPEADAASYVAQCLRSALTVGAKDGSDQGSTKARQEAIALLTCIVRATQRQIAPLLGAPAEKRTEDDTARLRGYIRLADKLTRETYFGSGAYDIRVGPEKPVRDRINTEAHRRFVLESGDLIDALLSLSEIGVASITHTLLETLETFIDIEPDRSFRRIADLVVLGARGGYQLETLALKLVVRLLERFLADYRALLQEPNNQQRLIAALDVFVGAGWPEAWQLTYRLDEIFR